MWPLRGNDNNAAEGQLRFNKIFFFTLAAE